MANASSYKCTIYNPNNARKKCVIYAYQNGEHIYFSMICRAAHLDMLVYGTMESIINYVKKYGNILAKLTYILRTEERYIFANIVECLDTVNRELKRGMKK